MLSCIAFLYFYLAMIIGDANMVKPTDFSLLHLDLSIALEIPHFTKMYYFHRSCILYLAKLYFFI